MKNYDFGKCDCGGSLAPQWFEEEEIICKGYGYPVKTGRKRRNINELNCIECCRNYPIDDSYATEWK